MFKKTFQKSSQKPHAKGGKVKRIVLKILYWIAGAALTIFAIFFAFSLGQTAKPPYITGVTFSYIYAANQLHLDWKATYLDILDNLQVRNIRLPVYWDDIESAKGQFDFSNLDFEVQNAQARNAKLILVIGRRTPRWPECHIPDWAVNETQDQQEQDLLTEMTAVINRYKDNPALQDWQVENEPFLVKFGLCPTLPVAADLDKEIALVRQLDPNHPIITTDSGELSVWLPAASRGDIFGSTLYRNVYVDKLQAYMSYWYLPSIFYRAKEGLVHLFYPNKPIINIELQGEPWTHNDITTTPFAEQEKTFKAGSLTYNLNFAHTAGFSTVYLWGVEYWYWAAQHGHPEFLQEAKGLLAPAAQANGTSIAPTVRQ